MLFRSPPHLHRTRDTATLLQRTKATVSPLALSLSLKVFGKEIMISLSMMKSGVHVRPMGFFEEELGFGRREKRIVRIRRVLGLGRGIRALDKPHLYSHRERERERERERTGWCCSPLAKLCVLSQPKISLIPL